MPCGNHNRLPEPAPIGPAQICVTTPAAVCFQIVPGAAT